MSVNKGMIFKQYIDCEKSARIWESRQEKGTELIRVDSEDFDTAFEIGELAKELGFPKESWHEHHYAETPYVSMVFDVGTYKDIILWG